MGNSECDCGRLELARACEVYNMLMRVSVKQKYLPEMNICGSMRDDACNK